MCVCTFPLALGRRCRLYRATDGELKQRGTGDLKILKHRATGKYRVVMRQEKTLKLILNFSMVTATALVRCKRALGWVFVGPGFVVAGGF